MASGPYCEISDLPAGVIFDPSDQVLVEEYLATKVLGRALPCDVIKEMDVYLHNPDELPIDIDIGHKKWAYFFVFETREEDETRRAPGGLWKRTIGGIDEAIKDKKRSEVIAFKSRFEFWKEGAKARKTGWKMKKYRLNDELPRFKNVRDPKMRDCVVCKIYKSVAQRPAAKRFCRMPGLEDDPE